MRSSILTSTAVSLATFAHHLARRLVGTEALEGGGTQLTRACPFNELELRHELGLDVMGGSRRRADVKQALLMRQWFHQACQLLEHRVSKTGSDLACVYQFAVVVVPDQERARISAPFAFALQPSSDHELLTIAVLDLSLIHI